jgi:hypothetical protein
MLWKSRGGRPTTRNGGGRRHSVIEESKRGSENSAGQDGLLTNSNENPALHSAHSIGPLPFEQDQQSAGSPSVSQNCLGPPEVNQSLEQVGTPVQPTKNSHFSLMKFRHASDPQLSATFAAGNPSPLPSMPSKHTMLWSNPNLSIQTY